MQVGLLSKIQISVVKSLALSVQWENSMFQEVKFNFEVQKLPGGRGTIHLPWKEVMGMSYRGKSLQVGHDCATHSNLSSLHRHAVARATL